MNIEEMFDDLKKDKFFMEIMSDPLKNKKFLYGFLNNF